MAFDNKPITECYWGTGKGRVWLVGWMGTSSYPA